MTLDYSDQINVRKNEPHPFDEKLKALYGTLNQLKSSSNQPPPQQQPDPQQLQMQQMQMQQMQTAQMAQQQNMLVQQALQQAQNMDPLARHRMALELRQNALAGNMQNQDYALNNQALSAKDYPNAFGDQGKRVQQILLASGMLNGRPTTQDHYDYIRNYLAQ
jgi:uncharacterized protein involved in copper resistance